MKKHILLFAVILAFTTIAKAQWAYCGNFCVDSIRIDTVGIKVLNVTIFNGDTYNINYPVVVVVDTMGGHDSTIGNINHQPFQFVFTADTTVTFSIPTNLDSLPWNFKGIVYLTDSLYHTHCSYAYPMNCSNLGVHPIAAEISTLSIFPNPATNTFNIALGNLHQHTAMINMYNNNGELVKAITTYTAETAIETNNLATGLYFITADVGTNRLTGKVVITH